MVWEPPLSAGTVTVAFQNPYEFAMMVPDVDIWTAVAGLGPTQNVTGWPTSEKFPAMYSIPKTWALTVGMSLTVVEPTTPVDPVSLPQRRPWLNAPWTRSRGAPVEL
jgi:hypothetical protein